MCRKLRPRHLALLSAGLIGAIQLAGCAAPAPLPPSVAVAAPSAQRVEVTHRVRFDTDQEQPTALELAGLDSFLSQIAVGTRAEFRVIDRAHEGAEDTHALDLSARRAEAIARRIRQRMGPEAAVSTAALSESAPLGPWPREGAWAPDRSIEIVASTYIVQLPPCPDWSRDPAFDPRNLPLSSLGCANAVNLGLMIADPSDLARGRTLGPADGTREAEAVVRYRTDKVRALQQGIAQQ